MSLHFKKTQKSSLVTGERAFFVKIKHKNFPTDKNKADTKFKQKGF